MKIKTPYFTLNFEILFIILFFISIFSFKVRVLLFSFYICYSFILFHELSHMLLAAIFGKELREFKFSISGVCISFKENKYITKKEKENVFYIIKEILIYLAGPVSNIVLAILFRDIKLVYEVNIFLALLNLFPIYPLDGYNILYNLLISKLNHKSTIKVLNLIQNLGLIIIFIVSLIQLFIFSNPSSFIFLLYLYISKNKANKILGNVEKLHKNRY